MNPKNILITGASSGLGSALSLSYAKKGVTLFLSGRNEKRLDEVKAMCIEKGANVYSKIIDIRDQESMEEYVKQCDEIYPIDLVIANAGVSGGTLSGIESNKQAHTIFETNVIGIINTIQPLLPLMAKRKLGQIALISSIAAYLPLSSCPSYAASKIAVKTYGEALAIEMQQYGVTVTVVTPGYIQTAMTKVNNFPMPFMISAKRAAKIIKQKLKPGKNHIAFPLRYYILVKIMSNLPWIILKKILAKLPGKPPLAE